MESDFFGGDPIFCRPDPIFSNPDPIFSALTPIFFSPDAVGRPKIHPNVPKHVNKNWIQKKMGAARAFGSTRHTYFFGLHFLDHFLDPCLGRSLGPPVNTPGRG